MHAPGENDTPLRMRGGDGRDGGDVEPVVEVEPEPGTDLYFSFVWPAVSCFDREAGERLF